MNMHFNIYQYSFNDYIYNSIILNFYKIEVWIFLAVLPILHCLINFNKPITKYYLMHFLFNMYVSISTFNDTVFILKYPYDVKQVSNFISFMVVLFHMYHIIFYYNKIDFDEIVHHVWIVFTILPVTWLYYCNIANASLFFMTGLPGGITYLLLVLKNMEIISSLKEKQISKHLNMWIRIPGAVIVGYIIFINSINSQSYIEFLSLIFCTIGCFWNGIYFGSTIISSYAISKNALQKKSE